MPSIINDCAELIELSHREDNDYGASVIVVPDIASPHRADLWSNGSTFWLKSKLPELLHKPHILEYRYGTGSGHDFSWKSLVICGDELLRCLLAKAENIEFLKRPLIFICHGLGGVVVKRVFGVLNERFWEEQCKRLASILSGIVFLGCPHPRSGERDNLRKLNLLLKSSTKLTIKAIETSEEYASAVISVSESFVRSVSESFSNGETAVPILSAYETKGTKTGRGIFSQKREIIVDKNFARTGAAGERMARTDCSHSEICNLLPESSLLTELAEFLRKAKGFANPHKITAIRQGPRSFAGWTMSDQDDSGQLISHPSHLATFKTSGMSSFDIIDLKEAITHVKDPSEDSNNLINLPVYMFKPYNPNPNFFGRQSILKTLQEALLPPHRPQTTLNASVLKTFALCGVGGLGKTQIAVEFAYHNKDYFDAIFFLQASDTAKLAQGFSDIAGSLGLDATGDQVVTKDVVLGWLSAPTWKRRSGAASVDGPNIPEPNWLLVFDNADDLNVLHDFLPVTGSGSILITSRDPLAKTKAHVAVMNGQDLKPLSPTEGGQLLRLLTGFTNPTDVEISEEIATKLSCVPLAINQIAGTITRRMISFEEFLELWKQEELRSDFYRSDIGKNSKVLWTVWAFEDLSRSALSLLNVIAFLDADQIPESLLGQMAKVVEEGHATLDNYPIQMKDFMDARTELSKSSLLERNIDSRELRIHRIIQDMTRLRMDDEIRTKSFEKATGILFSAWPFGEFNHSITRWEICEPLVPHISNLHSLFRNSGTLREVQSVWPRMAFLFMDLGWYYIERGNLSESLHVLQTAQEICNLAPEECALTEGDVHGCFYYIAIVTNDVQSALAHCRAKIAIFEKADPHGWRLAQGHSELAESLNAAGLYEDAIQEANIAIAKYAVCEEPEYADWAQMNKGRALCSLGRLDEASDVLEAYLIHREKCFGVMDTESQKTGQGLLYLGAVREYQHRPAESLDLYLKALAQYHSTVGPHHFRVADVYHKIGATYVGMKLFEEASFMLIRALDIYEKKSEYIAHSARAYLLLSRVQLALKEEVSAEQSLRKGDEYVTLLRKKYKTTVSIDNLDSFIPNWSK